MIIPDLNLLIYAYDTSSPFHRHAKSWWEDLLSGSEPVGLATVVLFGFVRIITNHRVFTAPLSLEEAGRIVRSWLLQSPTQILRISETHVDDVLAALEHLGTAGNLTTDAQLAAFAKEYHATVATADSDFLRFPAVRWINPLTGQASTASRI